MSQHRPPLQWRHNERNGVSNHQRFDCLLNHLLRRRTKKASKIRVTGLFEGNSPVTGEFFAQRASDAKKLPFDDVILLWFVQYYKVSMQVCLTQIDIGFENVFVSSYTKRDDRKHNTYFIEAKESWSN